VIKIVLLVLLSEIFTAVGQILYKKSTNALGSHSLNEVGGQLRFLGDVFARPSIWFGFLFMAVGLAVWLIALAEGDLSLVFPIGSIQYIMILFSAHFFLDEKIDKMKALGTFLVVFGIILVTISK